MSRCGMAPILIGITIASPVSLILHSILAEQPLYRADAALGGTIQSEGVGHMRQVGGLVLQADCCCGGLFHQCSVLLGAVFHVDDGLVDLLDVVDLLAAGLADLGHDAGDALHIGHDLLHGLARLLHQRATTLRLVDRIVDQRTDLSCRS